MRGKWQLTAKRLLREWRSNFIIWIVQWIGGSAMMSAIGHGFWREMHNAPRDWYFIGTVFIVGLVLLVVGLWLQQKHVLSTEQKLKAIEAKIPSLMVNGIPVGSSAQEPVKAAPKLVIHRAVYGAGKVVVPVADKLRNAPRDGLVIDVDNGLVTRDPVQNVQKRLEVEYSYDGGPLYTVSRLETSNERISRLVLPEDSEIQRLQDEITKIRQEATAQIVQLNKQHEFEESRALKARDEARAQETAAKNEILQLKREIADLAPPEGTPTKNDPLIRVEVVSQARERFYKDTKFILYNDHHCTAYTVKVQDIDLGSNKIGEARAHFDIVEAIPGKQQRAVLAKITSQAPIFWSDFTPYMEWKIECDSEVLAEIAVPVSILYTDYTKKTRFETTFDLTFIPRRDVTREEKERWEKENMNPPFEVRNIQFKRLKGTSYSSPS